MYIHKLNIIFVLSLVIKNKYIISYPTKLIPHLCIKGSHHPLHPFKNTDSPLSGLFEGRIDVSLMEIGLIMKLSFIAHLQSTFM
jgi:hypothetical protein